MPAGEEDGVEGGGLTGEVGEGLGVFPEGSVVVEEIHRGFVLGEGFDGGWVQWGEAAFGGGKDEVCFGGENVIGVG